MSFWLNQNVEELENKVNQLAEAALGVKAPRTLRERFEKLSKESDSLFSERKTGRTCDCTSVAETFNTLKADADGFLCLAPAIAFIQGSDWIQKYMCHKVKKVLFEPVDTERQPKETEYFGGGRMVDNTKKRDDTGNKQCNIACLLKKWQDGPCFHQFVRVFKVNLRIHKSGFGGCRSLLGDDETSCTIHLYYTDYSTGYSLVIPTLDTLSQLPSKNLVSDSQLAYYKSPPPPRVMPATHSASKITPSSSKEPNQDTALYYRGATASPTFPLFSREASSPSGPSTGN